MYQVDFPSFSRPDEAKRASRDKLKAASTDPDATNERILKLVADMGNTVLSKRAAADLHSIKSKEPQRFYQPHLFRKTLSIIESHHFRLPARRFALDLFDKSVMRRIVLDEDPESDSESESDSEATSSQASG